jgi:hypothetical protein
MNPKPPTLEDSLNYLRTLDQFKVILSEMVRSRELAIQELAEADTDFKQRKTCAEITEQTKILDFLSGD